MCFLSLFLLEQFVTVLYTLYVYIERIHRFSTLGITEFKHIHINSCALLLLILFNHLLQNFCLSMGNKCFCTSHKRPLFATFVIYMLQFAHHCICHISSYKKNATNFSKTEKKMQHIYKRGKARKKGENCGRLSQLNCLCFFSTRFIERVRGKSDRKMQQIVM